MAQWLAGWIIVPTARVQFPTASEFTTSIQVQFTTAAELEGKITRAKVPSAIMMTDDKAVSPTQVTLS